MAKLVEKLAGENVVSLLWHLPVGLLDRRFSPKVGDAPPGKVATLTVEVFAHAPPPPRSKVPYRITCGDATDPETIRRLMQDDRPVRLILTDEPYNVKIAGHVTGGAHRESAMASFP